MINDQLGLETLVKMVKASALVGLSELNGAFNEGVIRTMAAKTCHPIILPLSPLANCSEAKAEELVRWTEGRGVVACGAMPASVDFNGRRVNIAQCSSVYIFPGIGLGLAAFGATRVTDDMMLAAARALAARSPALENLTSPLLPQLGNLRDVAVEIAKAVAMEAQNTGLAPRMPEEELLQEITETQWRPEYPAMIHTVTC
jgi:malate dehydrogenase (oxaloacetate-decarboxylating)